MSRQSVPLSDFLAQVSRGPCFPKQQLQEYLARTSPSSRDCLTVLRQGLHIYNQDCLNYKQAAVAIWLCGVRNLKDSIGDSLSFFETLMRSRLLMLIFDLDGTFSLHHVLTFLSLPLEVTIRKSLQFGMSSKLIQLFRVCNSGGSKYNEILFLFELLLVKKIQKMLDEQSQRQFLGVLSEILPPIKMERIVNRQNTVKMKYSGFLRVEEDSCDTYQVTFKEGKLIKMPQRGSLPIWVIQAYVRTPRPIDLTAFRSANVLDVFLLMSEAEVYASSPLVDDLELLIGDEQFQMMFQSFLLGQSLGVGEYKFGCMSARNTIQSLKKKLQSENQSYRCAIVNEALGWTPQKNKK